MFITIICFSIGGYMLIQTGFSNSFLKEVDSVYLENNILCSSLLKDFTNVKETLVDYSNATQALQEFIASTTYETFNGSISFCIRDQEGKMLYQNGGFTNEDAIASKIKANQKGYIVEEKKGKYILRSIKMITLHNQNVYVENIRDITDIFINRVNQFHTLFYYTILLSLVSGIFIFLITRWLVKPIHQLSKATKMITLGSSISPLPVTSNDEIGQLTDNFNSMSTRLLASMEELQKAVERQEIFVGNFAHELKTPLTAIIGYGDMLRSKRVSKEEVVNYSNLIVEQGKRLETMSMKLMELIVLENQNFKMYPIDITAFFQNIVDTLNPIMKETKISLTTSMEEGQIYIEPDLMKTVFFNLLDNARKAIFSNGRITIEGKWIKKDYQICIRDTGCGMEEQELSKIKEAFYMVDKSRSRIEGGAGLGLAICEQIAKLHHASIEFESTKGVGTEVIIRLRQTIKCQ